jgi:hypothetical protein
MRNDPFNTPFNTPQGIVVNDPTKIIDVNLLPMRDQITSGLGIFNSYEPMDVESTVVKLQKQLDDQSLTIKLMRLKILGLEGKFTQEEVANIRKMIMSEDEASRTLADSIIENA